MSNRLISALGIVILGLGVQAGPLAAADPAPAARPVGRPATVATQRSGPRLPAPAALDKAGMPPRHRRTAGTQPDGQTRRAPLQSVDLTGMTKQAGETLAGSSCLTPQLQAAIAALADPTKMRGEVGAADQGDRFSLRAADKGAAPWGADRLLANPTNMNDEYVSLAADPVSGFLFAVFAATDLGGTDRDIHIARSANQRCQLDRVGNALLRGRRVPPRAGHRRGRLHPRGLGPGRRLPAAHPLELPERPDGLGLGHGGSRSANRWPSPSIAVSGAGDFAKVFIAVDWQTINWDYGISTSGRCCSCTRPTAA